MARGRKGRRPDQIRRDRAETARLYLQGWTQAEIAVKLGLSRPQISYDMEAVRREWVQSAVMDFNAKKAEELAKIDRLEREYWDAWQASLKTLETTTTEQTTDGAGESGRVKAALRKAEQTGDPRYLAGVERCIEARCKLLGLNAPQKTQLTGPGGGPVNMDINVRGLSHEQLLAIIAEGGTSEAPPGGGSGAAPAGGSEERPPGIHAVHEA